MVDFRDIGQVLMNTPTPEQHGLKGFQGFVKTVNDAVTAEAEKRAQALKDAEDQKLKSLDRAIKIQTMVQKGMPENYLSPGYTPNAIDAEQARIAGIPNINEGMPFIGVPNADISPSVNIQKTPQDLTNGDPMAIPQTATVSNRTSGVTLPAVDPLKSGSSNGGFGGASLTPEELAIAVAKYDKNPASIGLLRPNQKSQVLLASQTNMTPAQFGQIQTAQKNYQSTGNVLKQLEDAFNKTVPLASQYDTWLKAPEKYVTQITKFNNDLVAYDGLVAGSVGNLARSLFGEKGVLTDQDVKRVKGALPDSKTTNSVLAQMQFDYLKNLNQAISDGTLDVYTFGDKSNFVTSIVDDLNRIKEVTKTGTSGKGTTSKEDLKALYGLK